MKRRWYSLRPVVFAALPALLLLAACGGDDDDGTVDGDGSGNGSATASVGAEESGTASEGGQTRKPVSTPTPVGESEPLFIAAWAEQQLQPTAADLAALPQTEVAGESGVSLNDLAAALEAPATGTATIQGYIENATEQRFARGPLADIGATTILVVDGGRVRLVSTELPEEQLLDVVSLVEFQ